MKNSDSVLVRVLFDFLPPLVFYSKRGVILEDLRASFILFNYDESCIRSIEIIEVLP